MKIYIKKPKIQGAWIWIQEAYKAAWQMSGYDAQYYDNFSEINDSEYDLMIREWDIQKPDDLRALQEAGRVYVFTLPNDFPLPWGAHPNFRSSLPDEIVNSLNQMDNVYKWTFGPSNFHEKWENVHEICHAFDSVSYSFVEDKRYEFDVCFVGGWANNGFNEKRKIILEQLIPFRKSGLKCGFFINKNISHDEENLVLSNSKVSINIHDAYQRALGLDTNERTFKSLGLTGILVSDKVNQIEKIFSDTVPMCTSPEEMVSLVKKYVSMHPKELLDLKIKNRKEIMERHTYVSRIKHMESL